MTRTAAVVLAGGRSSRMGSPKAALDWHGSTLLDRTVRVLARCVDGPVVVVCAPGQDLPALPAGTLVRPDPVEGLGPLQGLAVGLAAAAPAERVFACSTDLPFLHPAYVARVLRTLDGDVDVVLPVAHGHRQPLAAAYRAGLAARCAELVAAGRLRPAALFETCSVRVLDEAALLGDPALAAADPQLTSLLGVNTPQEYAAARAAPQPGVLLQPSGRKVRAATVAGLALPPGTRCEVRGRPAGPADPLVEGDVVTVRPDA